jgi:hypothetical protein
MYYVGLDIHQRSTSVEILDCNGKLVKRAEWKLPWPQLADQLKKEEGEEIQRGRESLM